MLKRKAYRSMSVSEVSISLVQERLPAGPAWVGLDVGKKTVLCVVRDAQGRFERPWRFEQVRQIPLFLEKLSELNADREVTVAMEPTGTYGDALRQALEDRGFEVRRVNGKSTKDFAEIFDGVPSAHDGKDAAVVAELAAIGKSMPWRRASGTDWDAQVSSLVSWLDFQRESEQMWSGRLEALTFRHWPELGSIAGLGAMTTARLLAVYGGPARLAEDAGAASRVRRWTRGRLTEAQIAALLTCARGTLGVRMTPSVERLVRHVAREALRAMRELKRTKQLLTRQGRSRPSVTRMAEVVGPVTACVLYACAGDPASYSSGAAYRKALGLNLRERSSGRHQGQLRITKRGPSMARRWLYFAALRLVQQRDIGRWYRSKKKKDGERGLRGIVAVMRKLALAIHAVSARGARFDASRLFGPPARPNRSSQERRRVMGALPPNPRDLSP